MRPSSSLNITASALGVSGTIDAVFYSDAACTLALDTDAFAAAVTAYVKLEYDAKKIALPIGPPVEIDLEFFEGSSNLSKGKLNDIPVSAGVEWDVEFDILKIVTATGLGTSELQIWVS